MGRGLEVKTFGFGANSGVEGKKEEALKYLLRILAFCTFSRVVFVYIFICAQSMELSL